MLVSQKSFGSFVNDLLGPTGFHGSRNFEPRNSCPYYGIKPSRAIRVSAVEFDGFHQITIFLTENYLKAALL